MNNLRTIHKDLNKYIQLSRKLYSDKRTPTLSKVFLGCALFYLFSPIDLIPDFIPLIGQLDDLLIVPFFIILSIKIMPAELYNEHYNKIFKNTGDYDGK